MKHLATLGAFALTAVLALAGCEGSLEYARDLELVRSDERVPFA